MELLQLVKHGLDEGVELVGIFVAGSVHPLVIAMAVLQPGQDHLLGLVDDRQVSGEVLPSHPEAEAGV